ncbi:MAG: hypothetical protein IPJ20_04620 [Flammeovirgaceae bacterium]|nr:hypothetical protein [Flammeovirgaceae bacterium]
MTFEDYLISKKIDSAAFNKAEPDRWKEWKSLVEEMIPSSFTSQKLYLINPIRRKYLLKEEPAEKPKPAPLVSRPVMRPKPKMN